MPLIFPVDFDSTSEATFFQELTFEDSLLSQRNVDPKDIDEEKNRDQLFLLLRCIKHPDFVLPKYPHEQIRIAYYLVQLLDILPFTSFEWEDEDFVVILNFFLKQLKHFGTSDRITFKNCVILLKILGKTKIFTKLFLCLQYTTNKEDIYVAFVLTFCGVGCIQRVIKVAEMCFLRLLRNFISNAKYTSNQGTDIILSYILQENKEKHPKMYEVAVHILRKCSIKLNSTIKMLLWQGLVDDSIPMVTRIKGREFEVMYELHHICPTFLFGVWNQLEVILLGSLDDSHNVISSKKKTALSFLVYMFSEKNSDFALKHRRLWNCFKLCMNHSSSYERSLLVEAMPKFLINQPDLFQEIKHIIRRLLHDRETKIRFGLVNAVIKATKLDLNVLHHSIVFDILKRGIYDKNKIVRKQALGTLGLIYRRITDGEYPSMMTKAKWLANTLMHLVVASYYVNIYIPHIEKVIVKYLVPSELPPDQRMKKLLQLWCLFDDKSRRNFHHLQELKKRAYETVLQLLSLYQEPSADELSSDKLVWLRAVLAGKITLTIGYKKEVHKRLLLLTEELAENRKLLNFLQEYVTENNSIEDCEHLCSENRDVISYTSQTNKRSRTSKQKVRKQKSIALAVKNLCAKVGSSVVDEAALKELLKLVINCVTSSDVAKELHLPGSMTGKLAVELLHEYFYLMPHLAFQDDAIVDQLLFVLRVQNFQYSLPAMKIFFALSAFKPLSEVFPAFVSHQLLPPWQHLATSGTPAQVKLAVRCLCSHINDPVVTYTVLTECMKELDTDSEHCLTRAVAVGQFATHLPEYTDTRCIDYITSLCCKLVWKFVLEDLDDERDDVAEWYEKDCLPYKTKCRVMALKALTQLTIRLCKPQTTEMTLALLSKIVENGGALRNTNSLSAATKACLRLTAGCSFLKIYDVTYINPRQIRTIYFFKMATLMTDESEFVRRRFVKKLYERLMLRKKQRCGLPNTFISYFVLGGLEKDEDVKSFMLHALNLCVRGKRHQVWNLVNVTRVFNSTSHLLTCCQQTVPEFCVQTALQIVAVCVFDFTDETSVCRAYSCLLFLFNSLLGSRNGFGFLATEFHFKLFGLMRCGRNAFTPEDEELNKKIWATCEIGEYLLSTVNPKVDSYAEAPDPIIDERYHKIDPSIDNRSIKYLTANMETLLKKSVAPQPSAVCHRKRRKRTMQKQGIGRTESLQVTSDNEAPPRTKKQKKRK